MHGTPGGGAGNAGAAWGCSSGIAPMAASTGAATLALAQALMAVSTVMSTALGVLLRTPMLVRKSSCVGVAVFQRRPAATPERPCIGAVAIQTSVQSLSICAHLRGWHRARMTRPCWCQALCSCQACCTPLCTRASTPPHPSTWPAPLGFPPPTPAAPDPCRRAPAAPRATGGVCLNKQPILTLTELKLATDKEAGHWSCLATLFKPHQKPLLALQYPSRCPASAWLSGGARRAFRVVQGWGTPAAPFRSPPLLCAHLPQSPYIACCGG